MIPYFAATDGSVVEWDHNSMIVNKLFDSLGKFFRRRHTLQIPAGPQSDCVFLNLGIGLAHRQRAREISPPDLLKKESFGINRQSALKLFNSLSDLRNLRN